MELKHILYQVADGVATITINRADVLNALSAVTVRELDQALAAAASDESVRVLILTGAGEKSFVSGADISELAGLDPVAGQRTAEFGQSAFRRLETMGKPSIAAINGYALGGGCELAMSCTIRIAADSAKIGLPEVTLGVIPGYGGTQRLPRAIGEPRALEMIMTGRTVDAEEAARIGLVNRIIEGDAVAQGMAYAREFSGFSLPVLGFAREAVKRALDNPVAEGLRVEANLSTLAFQTADAAEGMDAFAAKRKPQFKDK